jgi:hypothetical protein
MVVCRFRMSGSPRRGDAIRGFSRVFGRSSSLLTPGRLASERWRPEACCSRKSLSCSSFARIWYTPAVFRTPSSLAHAVSRIIQWFGLLRFRFLVDFTPETPVTVSCCETATLVVFMEYLTSPPCITIQRKLYGAADRPSTGEVRVYGTWFVARSPERPNHTPGSRCR